MRSIERRAPFTSNWNATPLCSIRCAAANSPSTWRPLRPRSRAPSRRVAFLHAFSVAQLANALALASLLTILASGLALIFGLRDVMNFAHGALFMLGAYAAYVTLQGSDAMALSTPLSTMPGFQLSGYLP